MSETTCQHGLTGYCHDDATPAERESFAFLHRHAFDWASVDGSLYRDEAERYAAWFAAEYYRDPVADVPAHSTDEYYARFPH